MKELSDSQHSDIEKLKTQIQQLKDEISSLGRVQQQVFERDSENQLLISQLLEALNIANVGYVYWELPDGNFVWSSQMFAIHKRTEDFPPDINEYYEHFVHPEDVEKVRETIDEAFLNQSNYDFSYHLLLDGKEVRYVQAKGMFVRKLETGKVLLIGTVSDLTEQHLREKSIEREASLFKQMFYEHNTIRCLLNPETLRIERANNAALAYYGIPQEELEAKKLSDIILTILEPAALSLSEISTRDASRFVATQKNPDGSIRTVENHISLLTLEERRYLYLLQFDITQQTIAETELRSSEQQYRVLFSAINDALFVHKINDDGSFGNFYQVNDVACERLGYSYEELMQMSPDDIDAAEAPKVKKEELKKFIKNRESTIFEMVHVAKSGKHIPVEIHATFFRYNSDNAVFSLARDITERKKAEEQLKESRRTLQKVMVNLPGGVFLHNMDGNFLLVNEEASNNTGYTRDELMQLNVADIDSGSFDRNDREKLWLKLSEGESQTIESYHRRKDGSLYPVEIHLNAIMLSGQKVILPVAFDITERVIIREALQKSEQQYRTIFNYSPLPLIEANMESALAKITDNHLKTTADIHKFAKEKPERFMEISNSRLFIACNKTGFDFFGASSVEELNDSVKSIMTAEAMFALLKNFMQLRNGARSSEGDTTVIKIRGREIHVIFRIMIMPGYEKNWRRVLISLTNITRLKEAERKLKEYSQQLQEANESKDKFFSIIAHDLRAPLTGLLGFSDQLKRKLESLPPHRIAHYSGRIYESSRSLKSLLDNLLEWSRLQRNKIEYFPTNIHLRSFIGKIKSQLQSNADSKGITIQNNIPDSFWMYADENSMESVFRNLLSNALKFTRSGDLIKTDAEKAGNTIAVYVSDSGIGMSQETVDSLFKIGSHTSTRGTNQETGTGLGLILCKEFIELNKGTISVESTLDEGSTFTITVPAADKNET